MGESSDFPLISLNITYKIPQSILAVIYTKDLDVLLIERADRPGFWQSVTGSRDSLSEKLEETAIREIFEETGITVVDTITDPAPSSRQVQKRYLTDWQIEHEFEIFSVWRHRFAPGVTMNTEHVFGLQVPTTFDVVLEPTEHLNAMWLPWREAAAKCFSWTNREAIEALPMHVITD